MSQAASDGSGTSTIWSTSWSTTPTKETPDEHQEHPRCHTHQPQGSSGPGRSRIRQVRDYGRFADAGRVGHRTDCVGWDVRKMVLHVIGSADSQASPLVFLHQLRKGLPLNKEIDSHH